MHNYVLCVSPAGLDPLISRPVQQVLTALLVEREEPWYLTGLAKRLGISPSTLQRPLTSLVEAGILRRWSDGKRIYFARNPLCPFLPELKALLIKTAGLADVLRGVLQKFKDRSDVALIFGSFAHGDHPPESDVDLLVIGELSLAELSPALRRAERQLGREVSATLLRRDTSCISWLLRITSRDSCWPGRKTFSRVRRMTWNRRTGANASVLKVSPSERTVTLRDGETIRYRSLISTMPLPTLVRAMGEVAPTEIRRAVAKLRHVSVRCVHLCVGRPNVTEKHWIYYPEETVFHRIFVQANTSPHCNPAGGFGLTCSTWVCEDRGPVVSARRQITGRDLLRPAAASRAPLADREMGPEASRGDSFLQLG